MSVWSVSVLENLKQIIRKSGLSNKLSHCYHTTQYRHDNRKGLCTEQIFKIGLKIFCVILKLNLLQSTTIQLWLTSQSTCMCQCLSYQFKWCSVSSLPIITEE